MATVNVLDHFPDQATRENQAVDTTAYFASAFAGSKAVFVPVRRDRGAAVIPYRLINLAFPSGGRLVCESEDTKFTGFTPKQGLIATSGNVKWCSIQGGTWEDAKYVWRHYNVSPNRPSQLAASEFTDMRIVGCDDREYGAFAIEAAVCCVWHRVEIQRCWLGWQLGGQDTPGVINQCTIRDCRVRDVAATTAGAGGIRFLRGLDNGNVEPRRGVLIERTVFEDAEKSASHPVNGVTVNEGVIGLVVRGCWFEQVAFNGHDIDFAGLGVGGALPTAIVEQCNFNKPAAQQTGANKGRIRVAGNANIVIRDNSVEQAQGNGWARFVKWDSPTGCVYFVNNRLNGGGGSSYIHNIFGTPTVPSGAYVREWPDCDGSQCT